MHSSSREHVAGTGPLSRYSTAISGGIAGMVSRFVASPLDVIKIRLQVQRSQLRLLGKNNHNGNIKYRGVLGTFRTILREEGIRAFWKGNWSAEYLYILYCGTQFYTYQQLSNILQASGYVNKEGKSLLAGAGSGFVASLVSYPLDLLRTRFVVQVNNDKVYHGIWQASSHIFKHEGLPGLYKGLSPTLFQIVPAMAISFFTFESSKTFLDKFIAADSKLNPSKAVIAGSLAGFVSKMAVFPMDVVRKRLQIHTNLLPKSSEAYLSSRTETYGAYVTLKSMVRNEGFLSLYKGIVPGLLKTVPVSAVTFSVYEFSMKLLNQY